MRRRITTATVLLAGVIAPAAHASEIDRAVLIGHAAYPDAQQWCPAVIWRIETLEPGQAGRAYPDLCLILLSPGTATASWPELCPTVVHEIGHLARLHFPENPTDLLHSAEQGHNMHAQGGPHPLCGRTAAEIEALEVRLINVADELAFLRGNVRVLCRWRRVPAPVRRCVRRVRARHFDRIVALRTVRRETRAELARVPFYAGR